MIVLLRGFVAFMLFHRFIILSLSFLLISCGIFDTDDPDRGIGGDPNNLPSRPWDGKTHSEPKYDKDKRIYYITDATHFAWIMKRTNDNDSVVYDNDTLLFINNINMDNKTIQGIRIFQGTLDGNDKTIENILINRSAKNSAVGLIGRLLDNGTIKDITIKNGSISGMTSVGGIVGSAKNTKITNVRNINVNVTGSGDSIGGIAGSIDNVTIELALNSSKVLGSGSDSNGIGGIVGYATEGSVVIKSAN